MNKMKRNNKNTPSKKVLEPIGTRIAKAVFAEKKIQKEYLDIFLMKLILSKQLMSVKHKDQQR